MSAPVFNTTRGIVERYDGSTWSSSFPGAFRSDTAAVWATANPVLAEGEGGFETDTGLLKIGNGSTAWNSLAYFVGGTDTTDRAFSFFIS